MQADTLKHVRKGLVRLLKIGGIVVALVLAIQVLVLPRIVHRVLANALRGMGLSDVSFQVRGASFYQTELARLRIDGQGLARVGNIGVDYTPLSLLRGRVETLWITGAEIQVGVKDGAIDLGPLPLNSLFTASSSPQASDRPLPFNQLELRSSALALVWEGRKLWVPVEGALFDLGGGKGKLDLLVRVQGGPVHIVGAFDRANNAVELTAEADSLDAAALAAAVPARFAVQAPSISSGTLGLKAIYSQSSSGTQLSASFTGNGLRLGANFGEHRLWMQNLSWTAHAELGDRLALVAADLNATAQRLSVDGEAAQDLVLTAKKDGKQLRVNLAAHGADWQLRKLEAAITGLFDPQPGQALTAEASFGLNGAIPKQIAKMLTSYRLDVSEMGRISADGQLAVKVGSSTNSQADRPWELSADNIQVALAPGNLSFAKDAIVLRGVAGVMRLSGKANPDQASVRLMPGSNVWVSMVEQRTSPVTIEKVDPEGALVAVGIEDQPAQLTIDLKDSSGAWHFEAPGANLTLNETAVATADKATRIHGLGGSLRLRASASPKVIEAYALQGSIAGFQSLEAAAADDKLQLGPWRLALGSQPGQPLFRMATEQTSDVPRVSFLATAENALSARNKTADLSIGNAAIGGTVLLDPATGPALKAQVALSKASLAYKPQAAKISGISAAIPVTWNITSSDPGSFAAETIQVGDTTYPAVTGSVSIAGKRIAFAANWPFLKDLAAANAQGWIDVSHEQPLGQIDATIPSFTLKDSRAMESLVPSLKGFDISGTFQGRAQISFRGAEIKPLISLTMKDAAVVSKEYERSIEGVNGTIAIDSLSPIRTPGGQRISVKQASSGKLKFTDGVLVFRIEDSSVFHVEGTDWGWAGGRVYTNSFRLDLNKPRIDLMVTGDKLQLQELLKLFAEKKATGEGTVYGRLPVQVIWTRAQKHGEMVTEWSEPRLEFGEGFLYATPGGGTLHIASADTLVGSVLGKQGGQAITSGSPDIVKSMLIESLRNLDYSVLKMDFTKEDATHLLGKLHVSGKGRGPNALEIGGITVNLHNVDDILREAVIMQKFSFGD